MPQGARGLLLWPSFVVSRRAREGQRMGCPLRSSGSPPPALPAEATEAIWEPARSFSSLPSCRSAHREQSRAPPQTEPAAFGDGERGASREHREGAEVQEALPRLASFLGMQPPPWLLGKVLPRELESGDAKSKR